MYRYSLLLLGMVLVAGGLVGCQSGDEGQPERLVVRSGAAQCGVAGSECGEVVSLEVLGPKQRGLLGGSGHTKPVPGVAVRFEALDPASGLAILGDQTVTSDQGGSVRCRIQLGNRFGDQYLRAYVVGDPAISVNLRFVAGISKSGDRQETLAGQELARPLSVTITDETGKATSGVPVYFTITSQCGKRVHLKPTRQVTDELGVATADLTTDPQATGSYTVHATVLDPERGFFTRGVTFEAMALNRFELVVTVLGGLAVFIFGMKLMSEGLQQIAGNRLKSILGFLARNRIAAVIAGTVITGLIQSSSACTVMVVGFVNAGLLTLQQAIGIIYGAAIGTTVTAQMVSFKLDGLALPAIIIGVVIMLIAKRTAIRYSAQALAGFGLLFLGMRMMGSELKAIASFPTFVNVMGFFDCTPNDGGLMPLGATLGAIAIGTVMTMLIQSSSATIGLAIVMANSGLLNFYTAVPLILGDNIGTTITALLASIGTNTRARQAAVAHTIFKMFGAIYMVALFYVRIDGTPVFMRLVDWITAGDVFGLPAENVGRHVASAHTLFNVVSVLLFLPFIAAMAWVAELIVPSKKEPERICSLEPHLLQTPIIAMQQSVTAMLDMTKSAWELANDALAAVLAGRVTDRHAFLEREAKIDESQHEVIHYLAELTRQTLDEGHARAIPLLVHCVNDAERIGDHAITLIDLTEDIASRHEQFSRPACREFEAIRVVLGDLFVVALEGIGGDPFAGRKALDFQKEVARLTTLSEHAHVKRLEKEKCTVGSGIVFTEMLTIFEAIANHFVNIAERSADLSLYRGPPRPRAV